MAAVAKRLKRIHAATMNTGAGGAGGSRKAPEEKEEEEEEVVEEAEEEKKDPVFPGILVTTGQPARKLHIIYELELLHGCKYVGCINMPKNRKDVPREMSRRLAQHRDGQGAGAEWTRIHAPTGKFKYWPDQDLTMELVRTLFAMDATSINHVRGGPFVTAKIKPHERKMIEKLISYYRNACLGCNEVGHWVGNCPQSKKKKPKKPPAVAAAKAKPAPKPAAAKKRKTAPIEIE